MTHTEIANPKTVNTPPAPGKRLQSGPRRMHSTCSVMMRGCWTELKPWDCSHVESYAIDHDYHVGRGEGLLSAAWVGSSSECNRFERESFATRFRMLEERPPHSPLNCLRRLGYTRCIPVRTLLSGTSCRSRRIRRTRCLHCRYNI